MTRSHGPSLSRLVQTCLKKECDLGESTSAGLVVAVSGGPDSFALADVLSDLRRRWQKLRLLVVSIDHGLRPESADECERVESFCRARALPFLGVRVTVTGAGGVQAAAREARYAALEQAAEAHFGADGLIATAHHADDRAETLLLRLLRGVSLEGLGVLPPRDGRRLRPMVRATRRDVLLHCQRHELQPALDPSNADPRFLRVRVRTELLPLLTSLSPQVVQALNTLADEAGQLGQPSLLSRAQRHQLRLALENPALAVDLPLTRDLRLVRTRTEGPTPATTRRRETKAHAESGNIAGKSG
jgi:tRNA(Ile)-lysidine synthase